MKRLRSHVLSAIALLAATGPATAATYTVTTTADSGAGSLREALTSAAASPEKDTVQFSVPGGAQTIALSSPLPDLASDILQGPVAPDTVTLEFSSGTALTVTGESAEIRRLGFHSTAAAGTDPLPIGLALSGSGRHIVSGSSFTGEQTGIRITSNVCHIGGVTGNLNTLSCRTGIDIGPGSGNTIQGNVFGEPTPLGAFDTFQPTQTISIKVGTGTGFNNVVSDTASGAVNTFDGVETALLAIDSAQLSFNGNQLGLVRRNSDGVSPEAAAVKVFGGSGFLARGNTITFTGGAAIRLEGSLGAYIESNILENFQMAWLSSFPAPNLKSGIVVYGTWLPDDQSGPRHGAPQLIAGNLIRGMTVGIAFTKGAANGSGSGGDFSSTSVVNNTIGLPETYQEVSGSPTTLPSLANTSSQLALVMHGIVLRGPGTFGSFGIGSIMSGSPAQPNTIVATYPVNASRKSGDPDTAASYPASLDLSRNRILATQFDPIPGEIPRTIQSLMLYPADPGLPLTQTFGYVTPANDPLDADTSGTNRLQNHPVLTSATPQAVSGTLGSAPNQQFTIQVYAATVDGTRITGIPVLAGDTPVSTDASGNAPFSISFSSLPGGGLQTGSMVWAMATDASGNSSHVSNYVSVNDAPTVSFATPPAGSLAVEGSDFLVTLVRAGNLSAASTVDFTAIAMGGLGRASLNDFTLPAAVVFAPGESEKLVPIPITQDTTQEGNEKFTFLLGNLQGARAGQTTSLEITIQVSDVPPVISIMPPGDGGSATEGTPYILMLRRTGDLSAQSTVNLTASPASGTYPAGTDDFTQPATVVFAPGESEKTVAIPIVDDALPEGREQVRVALGTMQGAVAGTENQTTLTIAASDRIQLTLQSLTVAEGTGGTQSVLLNASIDRLLNPNPPLLAMTIYFIEEGTAVRNEDYTRSGTTASHPVSFTGLSFAIPFEISGDSVVEADETIIVRPDLTRLSTFPDGTPVLDLSGVSPGVISILNDDLPVASVVPLNQNISEGGNGSQTPASLTIQLASAAPVIMPVQWQTVAGTATAGEDFTAASGEVVFLPGESSKVISVNVLGDDVVDRWPADAETFHVDVTRPNGAATQTARATLSITDDDVRTVTVGDASLMEGNAGNQVFTFTASIPQPTGSPVSFDWATADVTAGVADYVPVTGSVTIPAGQTSASFGVQVKGDTLYEFAETFRVLLTNNLNATLGRAEITGTIQNDDTAPVLSVESTVVTVGPDEMEYYAWFRVRTSATSGAPVQFGWSTLAGTATPGVDYQESSGAVTIPAGERTRWVAVPVFGDTEVEPDETFNFLIPGASGASVPAGGASAAATLKEVAISEFFPVPGASNLYVIRFPTGLGQRYIVEESQILDDELSWVGVNSFQGTGTRLTHTQYSDSPHSYFRVRVLASPPSN